MAGEIQIGGTTFATESGGAVTVSNVDSATNRQNLGLEIGVDVQGFDADTTKNDVANTFTANQIILVTDNTNAALRVTQLGTGNALVVEDSANPDSTPFVINSSGDVIIGNNGTFSFTAINIRLSQSLGQIYCCSNNVDAGVFYRPTTNTGHGVIVTRSDVGGTNTNVGTGYANGTFAATSDATKKKNITDARNYLDDIKRIRVVKYNWITDEEDTPKEIGWIAQEVEEIFPGMVVTEEGSKLLKKEVFLPMLMKCVQEQQTLIESQQSQIDALTARIEALETT